MPVTVKQLLPNRTVRLRLLAHTRRIVGVMLPLGAGIGFLVALALRGLAAFAPMVLHVGWRTHLTLLLPAVGLALTTGLLTLTRIGPVSLFRDMDQARRDPYRTFPFRVSIAKVMGCVLTIGFGGSAGVEGPCKWFGAAVGLQYHRLLRAGARRIGWVRRLTRPALIMVQGGAAAALSAVFRAPISGALMAAEHDGRLAPEATLPCLVAAASGYVFFSAIMGHAPLIPLPTSYPTSFGTREIFLALLLGLACGLAANLYRWAEARLRSMLAPLALPWRGLAAGTGLCLLALPAHFLAPDLPVTQGGGLELIQHFLYGDSLPQHALLYLALKLAATALTFAGGGIGGLWLPSLAMGAAVGAAFDAWLALGHAGYMTLVGAAAVAGATHATVLVPVVFLAETTGHATLVVPALIGTTVSYLVAREQSTTI